MKIIAALVFALALSGPPGRAGGPRPAPLPADRVQDGNTVYTEDTCVTDQYGKVFCAPNGGGAMRQDGTVVCGKGACTKNGDGEVWCSAEPGGGAAVDSYKEAKCAGGCERASASNCVAGE